VPEHFIVIEERLKAMDAMDRGWIPVHLGVALDGVAGPLPDLERRKLSRSLARVVLPDFRLVVQDHVQQRVTDFQFAVVFDIAQFAELVHEKAHARSSRADHLREGFLTKLPDDRLNRGLLAEIRQKQKGPRQPFLARIE